MKMNSKVMIMSALVMCGCSKMSERVPSMEQDVVELSFSVPSQGNTKVSGTVDEESVEDLQIFVFGSDGQLQAYGHSESDQLTLTCSTGEKRIAALVNSPQQTTIKNENELQGLVSSFSDNSLGRFVMTGIDDKEVTKTESVIIPVSRLVSKVVLANVKNDFIMEQHQEMDFSIKSVFLTNAAKDRKYMSASTPSGLYNSGVSDMDEIIAQAGNMMYESLGSQTISYGETYQSGNYLYCYPNPHSDSATSTYLVVEATLGQALYYYPVKLPPMESNKCYNVSLTVCRPGSSTPDTPVETANAVFEVEVQPWAGNIAVDDTI